MCGIYYYENRLTKYMDMNKLKMMQKSFYKTSHRGPDRSDPRVEHPERGKHRADDRSDVGGIAQRT